MPLRLGSIAIFRMSWVVGPWPCLVQAWGMQAHGKWAAHNSAPLADCNMVTAQDAMTIDDSFIETQSECTYKQCV